MNTDRMKPSEMRDKNKRIVFDVHYLWQLFVENKKWFALSFIVCLCCAVAYVYLSRPAYNIQGKMMIIDRRQSNNSLSSASVAMLNQLPLNLGSTLNLGRSTGTESEKEILKTKQLSKDVVQDLGLYVEYRLQTLLKSRLLYKTQPINVGVSEQCLQMMNSSLPLKEFLISLTIEKSASGYTIAGTLRKNNKKTEITEQTYTKLPAVLHTVIGDLFLSENTMLTAEQQEPYLDGYRLKVEITPPMLVAKQYVKQLKIESASKKATSILQINLLDESMMRGIDFVNSLVAHYNDRSNQERQEEAAKNEDFINSRLNKIDQELGLTDADWEKVKKQYQVTDPKVDAEEVMGKKSVYESQLVTYGVQQQLLDYLDEYVNDPSNLYELIPMNVGAYGSEGAVTQQNTFKSSSYSGDATSLIKQHNALVTERKQLLLGISEKSPQLQQVNLQIMELHPAILEAIQRDKHSIVIRRRAVELEYNRYMSKVENVPEQERVMTEVSRHRTIKQAAFVSLLQKREETAMELANTTDKGRLIDETQSLKKAKPRTLVALLSSLIIGMLLPYVFFFFRRVMKKTVETEIDLKVMTRLPLAGTIPSPGQGDCDDAFRLIRNHILSLLSEGQKIIMIVSANQGDGKTFCATHLTESFTKMGENTYTSHLLDLLPAGTGSTHPADILAHKSLQQVLTGLRETYDMIILDGPEVDEYNETLIGSLADVTCFVCRSGKTSKVTIERFEKLKAENRLSSACIILNQ